MKKQLLIAAVAATMTSVAMADISISGAAKANVTDGVSKIEADLNVVGKSGATSVVANVSLDTGMNVSEAIVEDLYMTSSFEGVNIKVGEYRSGKSEMDTTSAAASTRYNLSTTMGGVTATFEETDGKNDFTLAGTVAGVSLKHKTKSTTDTETWVSGSFSGVNVSWNQEDNSDKKDTFMSVSTELSGVTATYAKLDSDATNGTVADGFFTHTTATTAAAKGIIKATGFSLATSVAGNKVTFKSLDVDSTKTSKVIVNRALASGATFEATYTNNAGDAKDTLDLELAVKF
jgi:hypothetical protein